MYSQILAEKFPILFDLNIVSIGFRLIMGVMLGGIIGMERERHRRPAGFRTHILVCVGSVVAMITSIYLSKFYGADVSRIPSQVISGIGFLGAGTIIVTGGEVTGLTTAASLWACSAMGLAIGAGFYEVAILCCLLILLVITIFIGLETKMGRKERHITIRLALTEKKTLLDFLELLNKSSLKIISLNTDKDDMTGILITVSAKNAYEYKRLLELITKEKDIIFINSKIV